MLFPATALDFHLLGIQESLMNELEYIPLLRDDRLNSGRRIFEQHEGQDF